MKLAIGQIGAELEAPAHLVSLGQHSIADLESLFKNWLYKEINKLELDWPMTVSGTVPVTLDDIEIELPDIDLNALERDPSSYFNRVFSPVFYTALEQQFIKHLSGAQKQNYHLAPLMLNDVLKRGKSEQSTHIWQKVLAACWHSLQHQPALFLKVLNSAEWPSMRKRFVEAIYQEPEYLVASFSVISDGVISRNAEAFLSKLSQPECIELWKDIETLRIIHASDLNTRQHSLSLVLKSFKMYVAQSEFSEQIRRRVVSGIINSNLSLRYLSTWFTVKASTELTHSDCQALVHLIDKAKVKEKAVASARALIAPYQPSCLAKLLDHYSPVGEPQTTVNQTRQKEASYLLVQLQSQLGSGCRKTIRALEVLIKLINTAVTTGELPFYSQVLWCEFIAQHDIEQRLPASLLTPLKHLLRSQLGTEQVLLSKRRAVNYALALIAREYGWIKRKNVTQSRPVYARRLYAVLCQIKNIPWQYIDQFKRMFGPSIHATSDLISAVEFSSYEKLLQKVERWLGDEHILDKQSAIRICEAKVVNDMPLKDDTSNLIEWRERNTNELGDGSEVATPLALSNVSEFGPSLRTVCGSTSEKYLDQVEAAQIRLTLLAVSPRLNDSKRLRLNTEFKGARLEKLKSLLRKYASDLSSTAVLATQNVNQCYDDVFTHTAKSLSSIASLLSVCEQLSQDLEQAIYQIRDVQKLQSELADKVQLQAQEQQQALSESQQSLSSKNKSSSSGAVPEVARQSLSKPSSLELARMLSIASQLLRYCDALKHTIKVNQASIQLHDNHELVVYMVIYLRSWQKVCSTHSLSLSTPSLNEILNSAIIKLNTVREENYQLNPYLKTQAQKGHMWWLELLDVSLSPDSHFAKDASSALENANYDSASGGCLNEENHQQMHHMSSAQNVITINDISEYVEARTFADVTRLLTHYEERIQAAKKHRDVLLGEADSADDAVVALNSAEQGESTNKSLSATHTDMSNKLNPKVVEKGKSHSVVKETSLWQQEQHRVKHISARLLKQVHRYQNNLKRSGIEPLKAHSEHMLNELRHQYQQSTESLISDDAGVVLLWPFLEILFTKLELLITAENGQITFADLAAQQKAHALLCELAGIEANSAETYAINALLGLALDHEFDEEALVLDSEAQDELNTLIKAAINRWEALKDMPIDAFRHMFLQRRGEVKLTANGVSIVVENKPQDVLLMKLPWGLGIVQLPWLDTDLINIEWDYGF
ncbi:hypothetical protein N473_09675 [Pseudoalteromonas luteoviolacea CPMOR-1]|uniref:Uncharacterized protein n=1 Tax=Pseudoalteromonas luteoviolacea CPMOR-1 TaxID=1365248 RepID=A0A167MN34_9GAMM|nr:contractile injection system tape measure protein [Pseudoalteromonas luteoviolacea]KZN66653.1 hypothetical protein N473_09675 [Pseudoalteromonas luteoviolacea CPMOR-1]